MELEGLMENQIFKQLMSSMTNAKYIDVSSFLFDLAFTFW